MKKVAALVIPSIIGSIIFFLLSFFLPGRFIIPDPCYYHNHEGGPVFEFFYGISAAEGFHPFPSMANVILTLIAAWVWGSLVFHKTKTNKRNVAS